MLTERETSFARKLDATTWGLLLLMTGVLMLLPSKMVPDGAWLILAGAILLVMSAIRYVKKLCVSGFILALGVLGVLAGFSTIAGVKLPLLAAFLVLVGATIMFHSWFARGEA